MRTMILSAVAALGLCLGAAAPAKAQYYWQQYYYPNTAYAYNYAYPSYSYYYPGYSSAYPYYGSSYGGYMPYYSYYSTPGYYSWNYYNPYTNQYRFWRWRS